MGDMDEVQRLAREVNRITTSSASLALLKALARLEAEHKRLEGRDRLATCATAALNEVRETLGAADDEAAMDAAKRLRADSARLEQARQLLWELFDYGHAELHEVDETDTECPGDDSCSCPLVAKFNAVLKGWEPR